MTGRALRLAGLSLMHPCQRRWSKHVGQMPCVTKCDERVQYDVDLLRGHAACLRRRPLVGSAGGRFSQSHGVYRVDTLLRIPSRGDRVEMTRCGIHTAGTVWYADQLQVLVKWDDGTSSSLRRDSREIDGLCAQSSPALERDDQGQPAVQTPRAAAGP